MKTMSQKLTEIGSIKDRKKRLISLEVACRDSVLVELLAYCFNKNIKWMLPKGEVPYKPAGKTDLEGSLRSRVSKMYMFVDGNMDTQKNLKQFKREQLFIEFLETIDEDDAKLLVAIKDGKMPIKGITKKLVTDALGPIAKEW